MCRGDGRIKDDQDRSTFIPDFIPGRSQDAYQTIRGFTYQVNTTIIRWLSLNFGEILELERGEDIDVVFPVDKNGIRILEQVKHLESNITLRSAPVLEFLCNAIGHQAVSPSLKFQHVLTTTAGIGRERELTYSILSKWNNLNGNKKIFIDDVCRVIGKKIRSNKNIKQKEWGALQHLFSKQNSTRNILSFIKSVKFQTGADSLPETTRKIFALLQEKHYALDKKSAKEKYECLLCYLFHLLSEPGQKQIDSFKLHEILNQPSLSDKDRSLLQQVASACDNLFERVGNIEDQVASIGGRVAKLEDGQCSSPEIETILSSGIFPISDDTVNPGTLLNARYEVIPFVDEPYREVLKNLDDWCYVNTAPTATALVFGEGGSGKSRLFIEWTKRMSHNGWAAGFLPLGRSKEDYLALFTSEKCVCVVVDYAECRSDIGLLCEIVMANEEKRNKLRIVFITRESGWLDVNRKSTAEAEHCLGNTMQIPIPPLTLDGNIREQLYRNAYDAFAKKLGRATEPNLIPDLSDVRYERFLYIAMLALAHLEELPVEAKNLLEEVVAHEERYWTHLFRKPSQPDVYKEQEFRESASCLIAAVTLWGGCFSLEQFDHLRKNLAPSIESSFLRFFHAIYPGDECNFGRAYISPVEPDILGEALVCRTLSNPNTPQHFWKNLFLSIEHPVQIFNAFIVLGRIAFDLQKTSSVADWTRQLLEVNLQHCAPLLLDAIRSLGEESAYSPLSDVLTSVLKEKGDLEIAKSITYVIPMPAPSLVELWQWTLEKQIEDLGTDDEESLCKRVHLLDRLSMCLGEGQGRWNEAYAAIEEAKSLIAQVKNSDPEFYDLHYPFVIRDHGVCAEMVGLLDVSLEDNIAAVNSFKATRTLLGGEYAYAASLVNLGCVYLARNQFDKAIEFTQEALDMLTIRRKSTPFPDDYNEFDERILLGTCYGNIARGYGQVQNFEKALHNARSAEDIHASLYREIPFGFHEKYAESLALVSDCHAALKDFDLAKRKINEAIVTTEKFLNTFRCQLYARLIYQRSRIASQNNEFSVAIPDLEKVMWELSRLSFADSSCMNALLDCVHDFLISNIHIRQYSTVSIFVLGDFRKYLQKMREIAQPLNYEIAKMMSCALINMACCIRDLAFQRNIVRDKVISEAVLHLLQESVLTCRNICHDNEFESTLLLATSLQIQAEGFAQFYYFESSCIALEEAVGLLRAHLDNEGEEYLRLFAHCCCALTTNLNKLKKSQEAISIGLDHLACAKRLYAINEKYAIYVTIALCYLSLLHHEIGNSKESERYFREAEDDFNSNVKEIPEDMITWFNRMNVINLKPNLMKLHNFRYSLSSRERYC